MSVLPKLARAQGRRDELPNQRLAKELAASQDREAIRELAANLSNASRAVQSDCLKVLYEIGYLAPDLIADHVNDFIHLLKSRNNRLVWGGMIALAAIAPLRPAEIFAQRDLIKKTIRTGSVITVDNGIKALALVAASHPARRDDLFPFLLQHLATCRPKDIPLHAGNTLPAVDGSNREEWIAVLEQRLPDLGASQAARLRKMIKETLKRE